MTLALTPAILEAAYEYLRATPPFCGWRLPHADEIEFRVSRSQIIHGQHQKIGDRQVLTISDARCGHTGTLMTTMAHEMLHLHQALKKSETPNTEHNAQFHQLARRICEHHGFDPKGF